MVMKAKGGLLEKRKNDRGVECDPSTVYAYIEMSDEIPYDVQ
jgi:hypothetical protein